MKKILTIASMAIVLGLSACSSKETKVETNDEAGTAVAETVTTPATVEGAWVLKTYDVNGALAPVEQVDETEPSVLTMMSDGMFSMTTDCNLINGKYAVDGNKISFTDLITTRMACPNPVIETMMITMLPQVNNCVVTDMSLELRVDDKVIATYERTALETEE